MSHHGHSHGPGESHDHDHDEVESRTLPQGNQVPKPKVEQQLPPEQLAQMLLFFASAGDPLEVVKRLDDALRIGVDVNSADPFGNTLLHWASSRGSYELVVKLLQAGADPNKQNVAAAHTPLHWACPEGNLKVSLSLIESGARLDVVDLVGREPLFYAVANERVPLVHLLLLKNAPRETRDNGGNSALHWASKTGNLNLIHLLISAGFDANSQNNLGETPLHVASKEDKLAAFQHLLKHGHANLGIRNAQSQTASDIAVGEVKSFLNTAFVETPQNFQAHRPYDFKSSMTQGALVVSLYMLGAFLIQAYGLLVGLIASGSLFYIWSKSKHWPAADGYSTFGISMIYSGYWVNMYLWYTQIWPSVVGSSSMENVWFLVLSITSFLVSQYLLWKASDPGYVNTLPEDDAEGFFDDVRRGVVEFHLCPTCRIRRPLRSKHDAVSNRCIYRFDHFCQFINQPVGQKNHLVFILALLFTCIHYTFYVKVAWNHLPPAFPAISFFREDPLFVYQFVQAVVYAAFMNYLLYTQVTYAGTGYTTNEKIGQNTGKYVYLWRDGQRFSPFSRGSFLENLQDFFFRNDRYNHQFYLPGEVPLTSVV